MYSGISEVRLPQVGSASILRHKAELEILPAENMAATKIANNYVDFQDTFTVQTTLLQTALCVISKANSIPRNDGEIGGMRGTGGMGGIGGIGGMGRIGGMGGTGRMGEMGGIGGMGGMRRMGRMRGIGGIKFDLFLKPNCWVYVEFRSLIWNSQVGGVSKFTNSQSHKLEVLAFLDIKQNWKLYLQRTRQQPKQLTIM